MIKIIVKHVLISILSLFLFCLLFILWDNAVTYYDFLCVFIVTIPCFLVIRAIDDYIRDIIIILQDNKTLLATLISGLILVTAFVAAYFIYTKLLNSQDIYVTIFDALEKYLPVGGIRNKFGIY